MKRSSSLPGYKDNLNGLNVRLPKITRNSWITNSSNASDYKYKRGEKYLPKNYMIMNRDKLDAIENNYYEMRYLLNDKINRIERNQRKFNEILQYSLEQNRLQNDINSFNYDKHLQNYKDKNSEEKDYLINILNQMPQMIEKKINRIFLNEYESSRNQKQFMENLREKMIIEMKNQRMYDYIKYKKQINELIQMKEYEEKEKLRLLNKIQEQKIKHKLKDYKYQNQFYNNPYALLPFYLFNQYYNNNNNNNRSNFFNASMDELMKVMLFKEMMGSYKFNENYQNYMNELLFPNKNNFLFDEFLRYRNKKKKYKPNNSTISTYKSDYNKYNSKYGNNVPFINSGKSYSKNYTKTKNGDKRFMTSHETSKKDKSEKTNKTEKKSTKTTKKSKDKSSKSKSSKSKSDSSSSSSESSSDSKSGSEDKKGSKDSKKEESKEENKSDESNSENSKSDNDDEEKKDEGQTTNNDQNTTSQPEQIQQMQPQQIQQMQPQQIQQMQPQQIQQYQQPQ